MFGNVLVALDGTAESAVALVPARTLASRIGARVVLARVVPARSPNPAKAAEHDRRVEDAETDLARIAAELGSVGLLVDTVVAEGDAPTALLREVRTTGTDLVIMVPHATGGLRRIVLGGVTDRVLAESPVPVMLV